MIQISTKGKVILAGAGPGDPDLISVKALKYLQVADVILIDRLVSPILVDEYAKKEATIIYVGKQCSKGIHTPQSEINELMVEFASLGKLVLRLKGGDVSLFSNVLDELQVLVENQIPYEIVPGISAAFGAAAYTGIPLTARSYSRGVRFLTLYDLKNVTHEQWRNWSSTEDTLVFYMSGQRLNTLVNQFILHGVEKNKGLAVVQQATTPEQKTQVFQFTDLEKKSLPSFEYVPTLLIVGNVVNLHHEFSWFKEQNETTSYFDNHKTLLQNAI
ncbi:uroporphyrinogen-III C-methyltransferase [Flavobacterium sp. NRK F7]|uniref:uroporphyrinogen-III C-methyltransferase n=1 Tax=Flavobacterium sp. NRK F7 TaxID=2954930 RepID=UPI0020907E8E|nr:uroporphyrinogen-III C-methyltransferase [Flavobacterium sp. NRK F7]MCO6161290.1 uroporphyrinogen-III C-methyltransferase [Flavobacterium sp. NRK F7]